jgi:hypothetical protein
VFAPLFPHFLREADDYLGRLRGETEGGREELRASGRFRDVAYRFDVHTIRIGVEQYLALLLSYGHVAEMSERARARLAAGVRRVLGARGADGGVAVRNHVYVCTARSRARSGAAR